MNEKAEGTKQSQLKKSNPLLKQRTVSWQMTTPQFCHRLTILTNRNLVFLCFFLPVKQVVLFSGLRDVTMLHLLAFIKHSCLHTPV